MKEYYTNYGNRVCIGENMLDNDILVRTSEKSYYWFHLDKFSSPHGVIECDNPGKDEIRYVASLVKDGSRVRNLRRLGVVYTKLSNLRLTDKVGCVDILRGSRIVYI